MLTTTRKGGLGQRSELEERMAPSLGDVFLECVIDPEVDPPQHADGGPEVAPEQRAKQPRAMVRLEHAPKDIARCLRGEFDGLNWQRTAAGIGDRRLAACPQIGDPATLTIRRLDERPSVEHDDAERDGSRLA